MRTNLVRGCLLAVVMAAIGCGDGGGQLPSNTGGAGAGPGPVVTPMSLLLGTWLVTTSDVGIVFGFEADHTYTYGILKVTDSGTINAEKNIGTYVADASSILLTTSQSTCPGDWRMAGEDYSVSGDSLTLSDATGTLALVRNASTTTTGAVLTYGCFDSMTGAFTASPLAPLN